MATILVIDDDPVVSDLVEHFLTEAGHKIVTTMYGGKGVDLFRDLHPDLVITDILMPDRGGLDIIIMLRLVAPSVPIIAISASRRYLDYARQLFVTAILEKPLDYPRLVATVNGFVDGSATEGRG